MYGYTPICFMFYGFGAGNLFGGVPDELYYFSDGEGDIIEFSFCLN